MKRTRKPFFTLLALALCTTLFLYSSYMQKNTPATQIAEKNAADKNDTIDSFVIPETDPAPAILASTNTQQMALSEPTIMPTSKAADTQAEKTKTARATDSGLQESVQKANLQSQPITPPALTNTLVGTPESPKIIIKNGITKKMLSYKHWTGKYTPSIFTIKVNDTPIMEGDELAVTLHNNRFTVSYRYSFMNGYRTGARSITFIVNPNSTAINLSFNWKNKWHVLCDQASPESVQEIEFKE
ncbi:MAG: hypothetical protein NT124_04775 [Candidatus Dependentiae bacterium]|nr:hypothetical protein [Candidatus Dependentiae bacterium]